jgi:hypothetical protein
MKCYLCPKEVSEAIRIWMPAKNRREKDQFRNLCLDCYLNHRQEQGYVLEKGCWIYKRRLINVK